MIGRIAMNEPIVAIDTSQVREGRLDEVKTAIEQLAEFVDANEPRPIAYNAYLDESTNRLTVLQVHPDSASLEQHMKIAGPAFPGFTQMIRMQTMDVYGQPSEELLGLLRQKARMLGDIPVAVHTRHAGFIRLGPG
jgi:quinol monooxygenase YgiN